MIESFSDANEELKRIDHLIFVSLKYTRIVEVIRNIVKRMIDCIDFLINAQLKYAKENKLIEDEIPKNNAIKAELLIKTFSDNEEIVEMGNFYLWLRRVLRAKYEKINEGKRHVGLVTKVKNKDGEEEGVLLDIDNMQEIYTQKIKRYMQITFEMMKNEKK